MPFGSLAFELKTVSRAAIDDEISIELAPQPNTSGGLFMRTPRFSTGAFQAVRIDQIKCSALGTLYGLRLYSNKYKTRSFFYSVRPGAQQGPPQFLMVDPVRVKDIEAPYDDCDPALRSVLEAAEAPKFQKKGRELYMALTARERACLLNIHAKATTKKCSFIWDGIATLVRLEEDRLFALVTEDCVSAAMAAVKLETWTKEPGGLHEPMPGFVRKESFKSNDPHANLQITFMKKDDQWAADIDIDEATGFEHTLEVVRNTFRGKTSPYQIHELLIGSEITPRYRLIF